MSDLSFYYIYIAPCSVAHFIQSSLQGRTRSWSICSSLLIFPEMFQVFLGRMTPN